MDTVYLQYTSATYLDSDSYPRLIIPTDGQSASSYLTVEPFAVLFWALGIVLDNTRPARRPGIAPPLYSQHFLILAMLTVRRRRVGSTLTEDALPPPPYSYLL